MNKTIVITGATSGIGQVTALHLAERGARIVLIARDQQRAAALLKKLRAINSNVEHAAYFADLSSIAEMKRVANEIAANESVIDVLINNAGAVYMDNVLTTDGLAPTFATNHLAYYVLTLMLLPRLRAANKARIVCTSSRAHRYAQLDFNHLQRNGILGYAQSKLMNLLFTRRLAQLIASENITVNAFHPGFVATRFADNTNLLWRSLMQVRKRWFGLSPEQGAKSLLYLAESEQVTSTGGYYVDCQLQVPSIHARNDADAKRLWQLSAQLTGVDFSAI
jgi:NAD(P)-dependent dehydrogenase (short-subunit alcohol dehydrogenase family)